MSMNLYAGAAPAQQAETEPETEIENVWAETIVTMLACTLAVVFASSVAVLMYLA